MNFEINSRKSFTGASFVEWLPLSSLTSMSCRERLAIEAVDTDTRARMESNYSIYQYQKERHISNTSIALYASVFVLLCFPLASNIFIRSIFAFFGTQMMVPTIAKILFCISSQIIVLLHLFISFRHYYSFIILNLTQLV